MCGCLFAVVVFCFFFVFFHKQCDIKQYHEWGPNIKKYSVKFRIFVSYSELRCLFRFGYFMCY